MLVFLWEQKIPEVSLLKLLIRVNTATAFNFFFSHLYVDYVSCIFQAKLWVNNFTKLCFASKNLENWVNKKKSNNKHLKTPFIAYDFVIILLNSNTLFYNIGTFFPWITVSLTCKKYFKYGLLTRPRESFYFVYCLTRKLYVYCLQYVNMQVVR